MISLRRILAPLIESFTLLGRGFRQSSIHAIEMELKEMENAFALVIMGALSGMPTPPSHISISLLPYIEREIMVMISRSRRHDDRLAEWAELVDL